MDRTPGLILPSAYSSTEELQADLQRRDQEAGFTAYDPEAFAHSDETHADRVLAHYGVKGMKWGVHRNSGASAGSVSSKAVAKVNETKAAIKKDISERTAYETTVRTKPGQMVRVVGGNKHTPHEDAINARVSEQIVKKNTLDALSNKDLANLVNRMNLEAQYRNLAVKETRKSAGEKAVGQILASKHADVALAKLGPHAALGKKVVNLGFKQATRNKGLEGGIIKDKNKDK